MKKLLSALFLLMFILSTSCAFAKDNINFIYINGSNTNDEKTKKWFFNGVQKFHPILKKKMDEDAFIKTKLLSEGKYTINEEPSYLYWGDLSKYELEILNDDINILKRTSPKIAQFTRKFIAMCFHDAIWISKFPNMLPVIDMLHAQILEAHKNGDSTVLLGYSAGTFVTYEYFLIKLPVIDIDEMTKDIGVSGQEEKFAKSLHSKDTCLDALFRSDILTYNLTGGLVANSNNRIVSERLAKIDNYTDMYCVPNGAIRGVINYASPISLFYSDIADPKYKISQVRSLTYKYLVENGMFYLSVNYADDPLGIPVAKNLTISDTKEVLKSQIKPGGGFYYDKSDIASPKPFFAAHTSYWDTSRRFSSAIVNAYREGHDYFYEANGVDDL